MLIPEPVKKMNYGIIDITLSQEFTQKYGCLELIIIPTQVNGSAGKINVVWSLSYPTLVILTHSLAVEKSATAVDYNGLEGKFRYTEGEVEKSTSDPNIVLDSLKRRFRRQRLDALERDAKRKRRHGITLADALTELKSIESRHAPTDEELKQYELFYCDFSR